MKRHWCTWCCVWALAIAVVLAAGLAAALPASELAAKLYPGYTVLQLAPGSTSDIAAAISKAKRAAGKPSSSFLIILASSKPLVVDEVLTLGPDEAWVLATPAGLQAAADGAALAPSELLQVKCSTLEDGSFITNSEPFASLDLLGLSITGCPSSALSLTSGKRLLLSNTHLKGSNAKELAEDGGAALLAGIIEVTFVNSACVGNYALQNGGCVNGEQLGRFTALNSSFTNNWKSAEEAGGRLKGGGVLYFESLGGVTITNCDFAHNSALYGNGGSLFCSTCGDLVVTSSRFTNNSAAGSGGCIYAGEVASFTVVDCNFTANGALPSAADAWTANGAAIATDGTRTSNVYPVNLVVRKSTFMKNTADVGGAIMAVQYASGSGRVEVHDCLFSRNTGHYDGGAIMIEENQYTRLVLNASRFEANGGQFGGAVSAYDTDATVTNCSFTGNKADTDGGAMHLSTMQAAGSGNQLALAGCTFADNTATVFGGAVAVYHQGLAVRDSGFAANKAGSAGAIYLNNGATATLVDSVFEGNIAEGGTAGAVRLATVGQLDMQGITMRGNEAWSGNGGAMQAYQVSGAALSGLTITDGYASVAGGGFSLLGSTNVTLQDCTFYNNTAPLGAGLAADSSELMLQGVNISSNLAVEEEETEEGGRRRKLQQAGPADGSTVRQFGSEVYASTTAGAILVQQSSLSLADSTLAGNTAGGDAGALCAQAPTGLNISNVTFADNVAETGVGAGVVVRGAGAAVAAGVKGCSFTGNAAKLGSGGAVVIDSGLGPLAVTCEGCSFHGNTAGRSGGAIAAAGPTSLTCTDCTSESNQAGQHGGWMHCSGCSNATVTAGSSSSNKAGAAGGSVSCVDCGTFTTQQYEYSKNEAGSGGAVAVQTAAAVAVSDCRIDSNSAGNTTQDAATSPLVRRVYALPPAWQAMYGVGAATAGLGCGAQGAGGGLCMSGAAAANIQANSITGNRGSTGGALFASADCEAVAGGCRMGQVNVTDLTARDNSATEAGGVLYTTTPAAVNIGDAGKDPSSAAAEQRREQIVQQLSDSNAVGEGGYGPAVASFPTTLSLMYPVQDENGVMALEAQADEQAAQQQQRKQQAKQGSAGRRLQQLPLPPNSDLAVAVSGATTDIKRQVDSTYKIVSAPEAGSSDTLQPFCPALGASIMGRHMMSIGSNQNFSTPISVLDAFGSKARSGPGSNWIVALSQNSGDARQLSGNMRGALSGGYVVLQGLSIQAEPGSRLNLTLSAVPPPGSGDKPLSAIIDVLVRPCVAGEYATFSTAPGQGTGSSSSVSCRTCAAPTFSFSAYPPEGTAASASETAVCQSCPERGICVAGMVIPESGAFQVHPRSTVIRRCPNVRACERNNTATFNLQGLQCANRRYIDPADIDPRPYTAMQCSRGYAGPFCSSCYRPGRNMWLLQQLDRSGQHQSGFTLGDQIVIATGQADVTAGRREVYGKSNGRCERCPHMAVSWLGFLLSRVLDLLVIGLIALLWVFYGWLSHSAAATAFVQLKHQRMVSLKMRDSIFGTMLSTKGGLVMTPSLVEALPAAGNNSGSAAQNNGLSKEMQREMRHHVSARERDNAPRQPGGPPVEHIPLQLQSSVTQPAGGGPAAIMEAPHSSRAVPPAGAGIGPAYASAFSLVEQPSVQHMVVASELSSGSLQASASRVPSGGLYHIYRPLSMRWSSAVGGVHLLKQQYVHGGQFGAGQGLDDDLLGQQAALMLMAVKHLACLAQVLLDAAQIAAVLLSLDLMFLVPDWAAKGLSGGLLTQAHTWQYVPFECLIPGTSESSAAVAQTVLVMLLPIIYTLVLSPNLLWLVDLSKDSAVFRQHVLAGTAASFKEPPTQANAAASSPAAARRCSRWLSCFWPAKNGTWTLFTAVTVASMAYCYSFYVANITAAFNCMSLSTKQNVPGEYEVARSVWVPDMQLSCSSPPQVAAMAVAILIGIPMLVGYWLLLLTLAWPKQPASPAPVEASKATSHVLRALANFWGLIKRACILPFKWLERPVRTCQRYTSAVGVCGESCAALSVWNVEWRWWWLVVRELVKFGLVAAATLTTMRGPDQQARVLLLLVVITAAISWRVQAGCSTSMNQLLFMAWCWLQLLALVVVIPSMQGISAVGFGGAVLILVVLVMLQCAFVIGCLVWRIAACFKNFSLLVRLDAEGGMVPLASVAELS